MNFKQLRHKLMLGGSERGQGYQPLTPEWRQVQENFEDTQYNVDEAETQLTLQDTRLDALEAAGPSCHVYNSAAAVIAHNTVTKLTFDSERFDTDTMHSTSSNTGRITFTTAGRYAIGAAVEWETSAAGNRRLVEIYLNNTTVLFRDDRPATSSGYATTALAGIYAFSAGDYIEVRVYQDSGGDLDVNASGNYSPGFWATKVAATGTPTSVVPGGAAGGALDGTYPNPGLAATVAGSGLAESADVLSVNVDGSTIEINADTLRVKASGITANEIAADAVGSSEIAADAVGASELADDSVASANIIAGSIVNSDVNASAAIDATKIHDGTISNTEFGYLNGVTSAVQTQLDAKQALDSDLTAIAGLSPANDDFIQRKSGAWTNRTVSQAATDLSTVHRRLAPVLAMADSNINIASAPASIDGLTDAGRYLLYAQTTPEQVGIYDWNGSAGSTLTRATDCASGIPAGGLETYVLGGTYALSTRINRNSGTVGDGADQWDEPYFNSLAAATINADSASFTSATIAGLDIVGYYSQATAADTTSTSTTITQIITMGDGVTPIPMGTYDIEAYIQFQSSNAANGISFRIGSPVFMDWTNYGWETNCGATNATGTVKSNYATVTLDAVTTANTDYWIKVSGSVAFSSDLSYFYLGIAREHATLYQTTSYKGTKMILRPTTI